MREKKSKERRQRAMLILNSSSSSSSTIRYEPPPEAFRSTSTTIGNFQQQQQIKKIYKDEFLGSLQLINIQQVFQRGCNLRNSTLWCSRAMVETVEKACNEMAWGENREQRRIGMALQEQIYRDLINETVKEVMEIGNMNCAHHLKLAYINGKLHRRGCRRRLSY